MANPLLIKNYVAEADIVKHRLVMFGSEDGQVVPATAAASKVIGVNEALDVVTGERVDVIRAGIAYVEYGGAVAAGDKLMAAADGKAVVAAAGANYVGVAEESGADGDVGRVNITVGVL